MSLLHRLIIKSTKGFTPERKKKKKKEYVLELNSEVKASHLEKALHLLNI